PGLLAEHALAVTRRQRLGHRRRAATDRHPERHEPPPRRRRRPAVLAPQRCGRPMMILLALFGGMALLLYGIRLSGDSLQRAAGARLRHLLTGLARNRLLALVSGATVTA